MSSIDEKARILQNLHFEKDAIGDVINKIEQELIALVGVKSEGRTKMRGDSYSVMTTGKLTRKLDVSIWESIKGQIPEEMHPVRTKVELDLSKLRKVEELSPATYQTITRAVTEKPAKVSVKIEELL